MDTAYERQCAGCKRNLLVNGIHQGIPFGRVKLSMATPYQLVCSKCYDDITVDPDTKVQVVPTLQRTGEETV